MALSADHNSALVDRWALAFARLEPGRGDGRLWNPDPTQVAEPLWLEPPPGRFFADPFLLEQQGQIWVFFEDYDGAGARGHIAASPLLDFTPRPALVRDWHLSYPFLIRHKDELFCVPEQHERGQVSLYRCLEFPDRWCEEAVLLRDFPGVDPTVIRHQDRYWMWVGDQRRRARDNAFLFHAPELTGPWVEHRQSPAVERPDLARPAGQPWYRDGHWYRPAQDRRRTYGGGMVVYQIVDLTPARYREQEVARWQPSADWENTYPDGIHHVCHLDGWSVWDAKRLVPSL